jgi:putative transposase
MEKPHLGWYRSRHLPHFDAPGCIQHITYRLADSLPAEAIARMKKENACMVDGRLNRKTALQAQIDEFLDAGYGSCILKEPEIANGIVEN